MLGGTVRRMTKRRGPGLASTGNRVLLAVAVGWLFWFFAGAVAMPAAGRFVVLVLAGVITYAVATLAARSARQ